MVATLKEPGRGQCVAGRQSVRGNAVDLRMRPGRAKQGLWMCALSAAGCIQFPEESGNLT